MKLKLHGILPAVVTPLDEDGRFHAAPYEKLLERLYGCGVHGIYAAGQTGEGLVLRVEDRKKVAEASVANSPDGAQVIVHVGAHRTEDAVELTRHASRLGVAAVSSLPPIGAYTFAEVKAYYETLAAVADAPLLVYYYPAISPVITATEQVLELCSIPNVTGLKFTDHNLFRMERIKRLGHTVFNGHDEVLSAGLLLGADGGIGTFYNLIPELFVELFSRARAGDWSGAVTQQERINELIEIVIRFPMMAAVKRMMTWSGIDCGDPVKPRRTMTPAEERGLIEALGNSSFREAAFTRPPA